VFVVTAVLTIVAVNGVERSSRQVVEESMFLFPNHSSSSPVSQALAKQDL